QPLDRRDRDEHQRPGGDPSEPDRGDPREAIAQEQDRDQGHHGRPECRRLPGEVAAHGPRTPEARNASAPPTRVRSRNRTTKAASPTTKRGPFGAPVRSK